MKKIIALSLVVIAVCLELSTTKCFAQTELISTGTGTAYDIAYPAAFSYSAGITITFKAHATSTAGPITLNINSLGARTIKKNVTTDLALGDIMLNQYVTVIYDGTNFQLTSPLPSGAANGWSLGGNAVTTHTTIGTTSNYDFPIITNGVERMRVTAAGGIAIGSNNPVGSALRVSGNDVWFDNNTSGFYQTSATSIGMGYAQQVYDASTGATGSPTMRYVFSPRNNSNVGTANFGELTFGKIANQDYGYIGFSSRNAAGVYDERVRIDAEGNLGVGIQNPGALLHVYKNNTTLGGTWYGAKIYHSGTSTTTNGVGTESRAAVYDGGGVGGTFTGVLGIAEWGAVNYGVYGKALIGTTSSYGVYGESISTGAISNYGVYGIAANGGQNWAGYFDGRGYFSGSLGIGINNPTAKLHIAGTPGVDGIRFPDGTLQTTAAGSGAWTKSGPNIYPTTLTDNVGIGTTSPAASLDINSTNIFPLIAGSSSSETIFDFKNTSGGGKSWWFVTGGSGGALSGGKFGIFDPSASTTRLAIDINGNVGIGTTSPSELLDINGNLKLAYAFMPGNNAGTTGQVLTSQGAGNPPLWSNGGLLSGGSVNYIPKWNSSTSLTNSLIYDSGTNVGIGTSSPTFRLDVRSSGGTTLNIDGAVGTDVWTYYGQAGTFTGAMGMRNGGRMTFFNGGDRMVIQNNGFVGIGTISPSEVLEVVGNVEIPAANEYKYATAKTLYYSIPSTEFMPMNSNMTKASEATHFEVYSNSGTYPNIVEFTAPIHIPDDAVIGNTLVSVYDGDVTYSITGDLIIYDAATDAIANYPMGTSGVTPGNTSISVNPGVTVDNLNRMYYLKIYLRQNTANLRIRGARVSYTVTKVD